MNRLVRALATTAVTATFLIACSTTQPGGFAKVDPFKELASITASSAGSWTMDPPSLTGALPNTTYTLYGEGKKVIVSAPLSDLVLAGHFTSSEVFSSTIWADDDSSKQVGENEPADTRILHLGFATNEVIATGDGIAQPDHLVVSLTIMGAQDANAIGQSLIDIGETVLFLERPYAPSEDNGWSVSLAGALIGRLDPSGDITFPILSRLQQSSSSDTFSHVEDTTTLSVLRNAAAKPDADVSL